jgi:hypothetical protein
VRFLTFIRKISSSEADTPVFRVRGKVALAATLTGTRLGTEQSGIVLGDTKVGHFMMAIDPSTFVSEALFDERIAFLHRFALPIQGGMNMATRQELEAEVTALLPKGTQGDMRGTVATEYIAFFLARIDSKLERLIEILEKQGTAP